MPETKAWIEKFNKECEEYNESAAEQLKEMNENKILNIIQRGGIEGWFTADNLAYLEKTFEFSSQEQAHHFTQGVGIEATKKDHHPEWELQDGGLKVKARLTSHFAHNTATVFDFELAEKMNKAYKSTMNSYSANPRLTQKTVSQVVAGALLLIGSYAYLRFVLEFIEPANINSIENHKPIVVPEFDGSSQDAEEFAKANLDKVVLRRIA